LSTRSTAKRRTGDRHARLPDQQPEQKAIIVKGAIKSLICLMMTVTAASACFARTSVDLPAMTIIPAGSVLIGSTEAETTREGRTPAFAAFEHPRHRVTFTHPFAVSTTDITRAQFADFVKATRRDMNGCVVAIDGKWSKGPLPDHSFFNPGFVQRDDEPAVCVDWADANAYAAWLSARTGQHYRLLTEDEWEYAARAGTQTARWWGDDPGDICAHANGGDQLYAAAMPADKSANLACSDGYAHTNPVTRFPANPFGLHDMLGNVWQWVDNCFSPVPGQAVPATPCAARTIRGGSWHNSASTLRAATRFSLPPDMRSSSLGFRVMREVR
jgi:formylglycine-generating enzyme required for sulfatase activity